MTRGQRGGEDSEPWICGCRGELDPQPEAVLCPNTGGAHHTDTSKLGGQRKRPLQSRNNVSSQTHSPTDEGLHHDQYPEDTSGVSSAKDKNQGSREQPTSPVQVCVCGVGRDGKVRFHRDKQLGLGCSLKDRFAERIYSQSKGAFFVFKKNKFFFVYLFFKKA